MSRTSTILALLGPPNDAPPPPGAGEDDRECQRAAIGTLVALAAKLDLPDIAEQALTLLTEIVQNPDADLDAADAIYFRLSEPVMRAMDEYEATKGK